MAYEYTERRLKEIFTGEGVGRLEKRISKVLEDLEWVDQFYDGPEFVDAINRLIECQKVLEEKRKHYIKL